MKSHSRLLGILAAVFLLTAVYGCAEKEDVSQEQGVPEAELGSPASSPETSAETANGNTMPAATQDASVAKLVALWDAGQTEEASNHFLLIDWQKVDAFRDSPALTLSEAEFLALPEEQRQRVLQETMNQLGSMRKLFFHLAAEAERLAEAGDRTRAEEYLAAVRRYGQSLSGPDRPEFVQMHGKAATAYADKKLSELP